jgi:hypothetical protein
MLARTGSIGRPVLGAILAATLLLTFSGCAAASTPTGPTNSPEDAEWRDRVDGQWAALLREHPGAVRPDVALIRYVSLAESFEVFAACMNEVGYPEVAVLPNGKLSVPEPRDEEQEPFDVAGYVCDAQYPTTK